MTDLEQRTPNDRAHGTDRSLDADIPETAMTTPKRWRVGSKVVCTVSTLQQIGVTLAIYTKINISGRRILLLEAVCRVHGAATMNSGHVAAVQATRLATDIESQETVNVTWLSASGHSPTRVDWPLWVDSRPVRRRFCGDWWRICGTQSAPCHYRCVAAALARASCIRCDSFCASDRRRSQSSGGCPLSSILRNTR